MARNENAPFPRGSTFWNGDTTVIDTTDAFQYEGVEYEFEDLDFSTGTIGSEKMRSNRRVTCRCVRNVSGSTIYAGDLVALNRTGVTDGVTGQPTPGQVIGQIQGLAGNANAGKDADKAYPVDEWLPAAGCLPNDLCWIVVDGFAKIQSGSGPTSIGILEVVVSTGSGYAAIQDASQSAADLLSEIQSAVGRAITATTGYTPTLNGAITSTATTLVLSSAVPATAQAMGFNVGIDSELMTVTSVASDNVTCTVTRGVEGTTPASHSNGATANVYQNFIVDVGAHKR